MYKAVIFDFFGVFCRDISLEWFTVTAPNSESRLPEFYAICNLSDRGMLTRAEFYNAVGRLAGVSSAEAERGIAGQFSIDITLIEYVRTLRPRYKTALLTNATREWIDSTDREHRLSAMFDEIIISAEVGMVKPSREIFEYTLTQLSVSAKESIFIDDRIENVCGAIDCGITSIEFKKTDATIDKLNALLA